MARDRLARIALRWGTLAIVVELWIAFAFVSGLHDDIRHAVTTAEVSQLPYRYSQLKPVWIKSPVGLTLAALFALALIALAVWMFARGFRTLRDATTAERSETTTRSEAP